MDKYYTPDIRELTVGTVIERIDCSSGWYETKVDAYSFSDMQTLLNQANYYDDKEKYRVRLRIKNTAMNRIKRFMLLKIFN